MLDGEVDILLYSQILVLQILQLRLNFGQGNGNQLVLPLLRLDRILLVLLLALQVGDVRSDSIDLVAVLLLELE